MQCLKFVLAGLLCASPAFAQGDGEAPAVGGEVSGDASVGMDGSANATVEGSGSIGWSRVLIDRPYVVLEGKIGAYGLYNVASTQFPGLLPGDPSMTRTIDGLGLGAGYGLTDTITAGGQYGFGTGIVGDNKFAIDEGSLALFGNFQLVHDIKMSVTASADFTLDLCGTADMDGCVMTKEIHAGLGARYKVGTEMAIYTGAPYGPGTVGQHLRISLESEGPISFNIPVGFMYQLTPELNLHIATNLARIAISEGAGESVFFGADVLPLTLGGLFSVNTNLDIVGMLSLDDLIDAQFDLYAFTIGARYYTN